MKEQLKHQDQGKEQEGREEEHTRSRGLEEEGPKDAPRSNEGEFRVYLHKTFRFELSYTRIFRKFGRPTKSCTCRSSTITESLFN